MCIREKEYKCMCIYLVRGETQKTIGTFNRE